MTLTLFNCQYKLYLSLSLVKALHTLSRKSPEFWTENGAGGHSAEHFLVFTLTNLTEQIGFSANYKQISA